MKDHNVSLFGRTLLAFNDGIRGKKVSEFTHPFWDIIAITTIDEDQRLWTETEIKNKIDRLELPIDVPFHVVNDPKGPKVGNGGSTMHCLEELYNIYGEDLYSKVVLLINAGGFSKRLPTLSIIGKLFQTFPVGEPVFNALEIAISMYMPFIKRMNSGVMIICPDALTPFYLDEEMSDEMWTFDRSGVTAIAHPSEVHIGQGHGVYVLCDQPTKSQLNAPVFMPSCSKVLQKPSLEKMYESGAVMKDENGKEFIYSDSCFFMSSDVSKKLIEFYQAEKPLKFEIDAFGDFLPALGIDADDSHTSDTQNVIKAPKDLIEMRMKVYNLLKSTQLNLIALNQSKFYHIGSVRELIHNFCIDDCFRSELTLKNFTASKLIGCKSSKSLDGVVVLSKLHSNSRVHPESIVEYSTFAFPVFVGKMSIISNVAVGCNDLVDTPIVFPDNCIFQTVVIRADKHIRYVTFAFGSNDDMKREVQPENVDDLRYFDKPFKPIVELLKLAKDDVFSGPKCSLWNAKLFIASANRLESFKYTMELTKSILENQTSLITNDSVKYSMEDLLKYKDHAAIFKYRNSCNI